mmetsp:Transcript_30753/g.99478  ORF Transcript_30753/g.99478 Transcript_30753/m.99478 type:complete len:219 (-) Transcript_30753:344-1000(-)|eukprot:scaffold6128_cov147-Isochrysis_galbana.AAC.4
MERRFGMRPAVLVVSALLRGTSAWVVGVRAAPQSPRLAVHAISAAEGAAPNAMPADYEEAETRGFELYQAGQYERAIRMFELAQALPGAGVDYVREKSSGMIGSATAPPNPRGMKLSRYATQQQKLIAQYNIACCCAGMGDTTRALDMVRTYLGQVVEPLDAVNEMIVDDDLMPIRDKLRALREEYQGKQKGGGVFGPLNKLNESIRAAADSVGVEWK